MRRAEKDIVKYIRKFVDICNIQTVYTNNDTGWADIKNWRFFKLGKNDRYEKVYSQGTMNVMEIWVDRETGVNYVFHASGYAGGMTPLLDRDGKLVISPVLNK